MGLWYTKEFGEQGLFSGGGRKYHSGRVDVLAVAGDRLGKVADCVAVAGDLMSFMEA